MHETDPDPRNVHADAMSRRRNPIVELAVGAPDDLQVLRREWEALDSIPRLLASRDDGDDHSWAGLDIRTLLTGEDSSGRQSFHDIIIPAGAGLPPHAFDCGDTFWYLVSGEVELTIGALTERAGSGAFGYAPSETTQAVANTGQAPARLLVAYFPAGADRAFAEAHELRVRSGETAPQPYFAVLRKYGFRFDLSGPEKNDARTNAPVERLDHEIETAADFEDLRAAWRRRHPTPKLVLPKNGPADYDRGPVLGTALVSGDEDSGRAVFLRGVVEPGHTAPEHHQPTEEECFFLLEGQIRLTCGLHTAVIGPGAFGFAPRNATHTFHNPGDGAALLVSVNSPAGHERGFEMMVRERANPSPRFADLVAAHGWAMHRQLNMAEH